VNIYKIDINNTFYCKGPDLLNELLILYFDITLRFPLENKNMLKKWVDSIGLTNWQPTDTDRICSDHFENDDILMTNDIYGLNNDAIPSIKPQVCIQL